MMEGVWGYGARKVKVELKRDGEWLAMRKHEEQYEEERRKFRNRWFNLTKSKLHK